jgi:hypothetical protein
MTETGHSPPLISGNHIDRYEPAVLWAGGAVDGYKSSVGVAASDNFVSYHPFRLAVNTAVYLIVAGAFEVTFWVAQSPGSALVTAHQQIEPRQT